MFNKIGIGTLIGAAGTIFSIIGMILDKSSQNRLIKKTIAEEVAKAVSNK